MRDGARQLDSMIHRVEMLGGMAERVAPAVGVALRREAEGAVAAQRSPGGSPWAPSKGGGRVLERAASKAQVSVDGSRVSISLDGPEALHNDGRARGGRRRQVIPSQVPSSVSGVVLDEWRRTMGAR